MGGSCDAKITGNTPEEMLANGRQHLLSHPEMMKQMEEQMKKPTAKEDSKKWMDSFMKKWNAAKDVK